MYRKSEPVSPAYSLRSSRAASPTDSWSSKTDISALSRTLVSRRSSRVTSPTNSTFSRTSSQRSSRAASPDLAIQSIRSERASLYGSVPHQKVTSYPGIPGYEEGFRHLPAQDEHTRNHRAISQAVSVRSIRGTSPVQKSTDGNKKEITKIESEIHDLVNFQEVKANPFAQVGRFPLYESWS